MHLLKLYIHLPLCMASVGVNYSQTAIMHLVQIHFKVLHAQFLLFLFNITLYLYIGFGKLFAYRIPQQPPHIFNRVLNWVNWQANLFFCTLLPLYKALVALAVYKSFVKMFQYIRRQNTSIAHGQRQGGRLPRLYTPLVQPQDCSGWHQLYQRLVQYKPLLRSLFKDFRTPLHYISSYLIQTSGTHCFWGWKYPNF